MAVRWLTAHDLLGLDGRVPDEVVEGDMPDIASHMSLRKPSACHVRPLFRVKVRWKGNPFGVMKSFRTYSSVVSQ
jgi:hypothetical protein